MAPSVSVVTGFDCITQMLQTFSDDNMFILELQFLQILFFGCLKQLRSYVRCYQSVPVGMCVCLGGVCVYLLLWIVQVCHWKQENMLKSTLTFKPSSGWAFNTHTEKSKISFKCSWPERNNNKRKHQSAMNHWITRAVTKAKLNQSLPHLTAEREVTRLIPVAGPTFRGFRAK